MLRAFEFRSTDERLGIQFGTHVREGPHSLAMNTNITPKPSELLFAGYNCAQAVLSAHCARLGLDRNTAFKTGAGFGAGIAREGEICGAVAGAVMALGLRYGRGEGEDRSKNEECYAKTEELLNRFRQEHGTIICRELIQCDLRTPEGQQRFKQHDTLRKVCVRCVDTATDLVAALT